MSETSIRAALRAAHEDALLFGSGLVLVTPHGAERLDPARVTIAPATAPSPTAECRCGARVFCASMADVFDNQAPWGWRDDVWKLIHATPHLDWLLLTKRPQNIRLNLPHQRDVPAWGDGWPNVWIGTTAENQHEADRRIPHLLQVRAKVRFLSCEPLLGLVDLHCAGDGPLAGGHPTLAQIQGPAGAHIIRHGASRIDWVIAGGESGPGARPMHPDWVRSLRNQCAAAGVPFFMKQMWGRTKATMPPIPDDLMIREVPHA